MDPAFPSQQPCFQNVSCNGESADVSVAEKGIQSSFDKVMKNVKNHSQVNNQNPASRPWDIFESDVCFIDKKYF